MGGLLDPSSTLYIVFPSSLPACPPRPSLKWLLSIPYAQVHADPLLIPLGCGVAFIKLPHFNFLKNKNSFHITVSLIHFSISTSFIHSLLLRRLIGNLVLMDQTSNWTCLPPNIKSLVSPTQSCVLAVMYTLKGAIVLGLSTGITMCAYRGIMVTRQHVNTTFRYYYDIPMSGTYGLPNRFNTCVRITGNAHYHLWYLSVKGLLAISSYSWAILRCNLGIYTVICFATFNSNSFVVHGQVAWKWCSLERAYSLYNKAYITWTSHTAVAVM